MVGMQHLGRELCLDFIMSNAVFFVSPMLVMSPGWLGVKTCVLPGCSDPWAEPDRHLDSTAVSTPFTVTVVWVVTEMCTPPAMVPDRLRLITGAAGLQRSPTGALAGGGWVTGARRADIVQGLGAGFRVGPVTVVALAVGSEEPLDRVARVDAGAGGSAHPLHGLAV